jgi:hypothetical protein
MACNRDSFTFYFLSLWYYCAYSRLLEVIKSTCWHFIFSRGRGSVSNNNGFWIGWLDLLALLLQLHLITINYNSSQSMTPKDSLHSFMDYECLLSCCDWLGSDLRIGHFFYERRLTNERTNDGCSLTEFSASNDSRIWVWVICYDRRSVGQSVLELSTHLGLTTRFLLL